MTRPQDAPLVVSLEHQYRELTALAARAERLRAEHLPPPTTTWRGAARRAYDIATTGLVASLDDLVVSLRSAQVGTGDALGEVESRA